MEETAARRKRINRLKRIILRAVGVSILIPIIICILLGIRIHFLNQQVENLKTLLEELKNQESDVGVYEVVHVEESPRENTSEQLLIAEPEEEKAEKPEEEDVEQEDTVKKVYLTFDDGPSNNTNEILDILKAYDVKATFFVVGKTDEKSVAAYQRIVAEGHTLAMHSYSHKYQEIYASRESFVQDFELLQEYLYEVTGVWPRYYRFPGGSSNQVSGVNMQEFASYLNENNITYFDWNAEAGDGANGNLPKESIVNNCLNGFNSHQQPIILMHDASEKDSTVEALPEVISQIRMQGDVVFLPITDETEPVQHLK